MQKLRCLSPNIILFKLPSLAKVELATARTECDAAEGRLLQCRDALNKLTFESSAADKESARVHAEKEGVSKEVVLLHRASDDLREAAAAVEAAQSGLASAAGGTGDSRRVQQELTEVSARIKELVVAISEDSGTLQDLRLMREDMERLRLTRKQTETDTLLLTNEVSTLFGRYRGLLEPRHISTSVASEIELDAVLGSIDAAIRSERLSITTEKVLLL